MKRTSIKVIGYVVLAVAISALGACDGLNKMKKGAPDVTYTVTPPILEAHAGKVDVAIKVQIPGGYFDKKAVLEATPVLKYEGGETAYPSYTLQGESVSGNAQTIPKVAGGTVNYSNSVPYNDKMRISDFVVRIKAKSGSKEMTFDDYSIGKGVIATSTLVAANGSGAIGKDKFQRNYPYSQGAEILFLIQQATLRNTELSKDEVKALTDFIKSTQDAPNREFRGVEISGYASPDGPTDLNTKLSDQRKTVAKGVIDNEFKKDKITASADLFNIKNTPEDWEGFRALMEKSSIQDKDLILRVLSMYSDPDVREKEIKNMSSTYKIIADEILPKLRRSKININIEEIGKTDDQILSLANSDPDQLGLEELLYGAALTKDADERLKIYRAAANKFPNDWRTHNNIGFILYQKEDFSGAKAAFDKANSVKANQPEVMNNLGVIELRNGNIQEAEKYFGGAAGAGPELDNNLGVCALFKGLYEEAVRYFGNSTNNNAALAKILAKKYDGALSTLNANTVEDGLKYYLKAIVGVRTNDKDLMMSSLRKAIQLENKFKKLAATDMEFAKFFEDATFKSIVQ